MTDLLGRVLDKKYRLVRLIGEGGMGTVWEAEHTLISRRVAVKIMNTVAVNDKDAVHRFFLEAQSASAIGHPNIVEIFDVGIEDDGTTFMVMELLHGTSLETLLIDRGSFSPQRTVNIILQVLSALHATHQRGIIHRDLKPDNVFVAIDSRMREEIKLLDFGVAKVMQEGSLFPMNTQPGTVLGTPFYMSPEQARGSKDIDIRTDIWSMGVMMYEMLSGRLPFQGDSGNEVIGNVLMVEPPVIVNLAPWVSIDLCAIVTKAMAKDRDQRFQTVAEMVKSLMPLFHGIDKEMKSVVAKAVLDTMLSSPLPEQIAGSHEAGAVTTRKKANTMRPVATRAARFPLKAFALIGTGALVLLAVVAFGVIATASMNDGVDPLPSPVAVVDAPGLVAPARPMIVGTTAAVEAPIVEPASESITVRIGGLPATAMVRAAGKLVTSPFLLLRSEDPVAIQVTAVGYLPYATSLLPNRDLTLTANMLKVPVRRNRVPRPHAEKWHTNPF